MDCPVCDEKLAPDTDHVQFRPQVPGMSDDNVKVQLLEINQSLVELKAVLAQQKEDQDRTTQIVE